MFKTHSKLVAISTITGAIAIAHAGSNLVYNGDFSVVGPNGSPTLSTALFPGPCAANGWETFQNQPNTETETALVSPPAGLPSGTTTAIYFGCNLDHTDYGSELDQVLLPYGTGPKNVEIGVWVYLLTGVVGIGVGNGGATGYEAATSVTNQWIYLSAQHYDANGNDNLIIGNASYYANSRNRTVFYATDAMVEAVPEPAPFIGLGLGIACFIRRRKRA